jgi:hypothetical protein
MRDPCPKFGHGWGTPGRSATWEIVVQASDLGRHRAGERVRTGMASLEETSKPSTFVPESTSSQVRRLVMSTGTRRNPPESGCLGHAGGTKPERRSECR